MCVPQPLIYSHCPHLDTCVSFTFFLLEDTVTFTIRREVGGLQRRFGVFFLFGYKGHLAKMFLICTTVLEWQPI